MSCDMTTKMWIKILHIKQINSNQINFNKNSRNSNMTLFKWQLKPYGRWHDDLKFGKNKNLKIKWKIDIHYHNLSISCFISYRK